MIDLSWLSTTVDVPLWGVLALAGFQRVTRVIGDARERRRRRKERGKENAARAGQR